MTELSITYGLRVEAQLDLAGIAKLIGDPTRAAILDALLGGSWLAAGELASVARVSRATGSEHLARLLTGGLVVAERHGRHRYFALAGPQVGAALEALGTLASCQPRARSLSQANRLARLRSGRMCYDHLAGRLGVALTSALLQNGWIADADGGWQVTPAGEQHFTDLGIDVADLRNSRRPLTRHCLDNTERRHHLAGGLGAALASRLHDLAWTTTTAQSRAVQLTPSGRTAMHQLLDLRQHQSSAAANH